MRSAVLMPSIGPASRMSISTRSGANVLAVSTASSPSAAMPTERYPARSSLPARSAATTASSSTMRMFALGIQHRLCLWSCTDAARARDLEPQLERRPFPCLCDDFTAQLFAQHADQAQPQRLGSLQVEPGGQPPYVVSQQQTERT